MKPFARAFTYTYIAVVMSQQIFKSFVYLDAKTFWMIVLAFSLLNLFKPSILALVSVPEKGIMFQLFSVFLSCILLNILVAILPEFRLMASTTPDINIMGNVVGSIYMPAFANGLASATALSLTYSYLMWLGSKK